MSLFVNFKTGKVRKFETGVFAMASDNGHMMIVFAKPGLTGPQPLAFIPMALVESVDVEDAAGPVPVPDVDGKVLAFLQAGFEKPAPVEPPEPDEPEPKRAF